MNRDQNRIILSFFPPSAARVRDAATRSHTEAHIFWPDAPAASAPRFAAPYSGLRLPREALLVARCRPEQVTEVVRDLRAAGAPAIFVLRDSAAAPKRPMTTVDAALRELEDVFRRAVRDLEEAQGLDHAVTSAAEWLLDNSYLVLTNLAEMRRDLPREYSKLLAKPGERETHRVRQLAADLVAATDALVSEAAITRTLADPDVASTLTMRDLWMFPFLLRWATIEAIRDVAVRVSRSQQWREAAYLWANRLASSARIGAESFQRMLARLEQEPCAAEPYFIVSLAEQLHDEEYALAPVQHWIETRLQKPLSEIVKSEYTREAAERILTANAFGSLRMLARMEFAEIFESVSVVEAELRRDPAGIYPKSDAATRDDCRRVIEKIARHSSHTESQIARQATSLARERGRDVTYFLLAGGVDELESAAGARVPLETRWIRAVRRHATTFYLTSQFLLNACFTTLVLMIAWDAGVRHGPSLAILGLLALFPLSELSIQIVNALLISLLPPARLAKLDFREGIPPEDATLVVVPMMLASADAVQHEIEKLEVRFLANQNANLWFGLFADFLDAAEETAPHDSPLLKAARDGIDSLNRRYPGKRFVLFHRPREWSESEQRWIGRERKRGKLDELNRFLTGEGAPRILISGELPLPIRYVLTLDSDTALPPGAARRLVEAIAHPLNRATLDSQTKVRREGYTIVQPRVSISLPDAMATRFTRVFADANGTDPYCHSVSDAQQDLFGEAIFHGKAIYDVQSFSAALSRRFPRETLLSHDLIEGAYAGAALANDIELYENVPHNYSSYSRREHRWIRGDWQIAPWIFPRVPTPKGRERNPLSLLNRWRIFDNLRRSLVPVASLLLLILGWLISAAPGVWSLVVALAIAIPALAPLLERWARRMEGTVHGWRGAADQLIRAVVKIAFLPHSAWIAVDAIGRAWFRSHVSRRNLLEWETAASAVANSRLHVSTALRQMLTISFGSVVLLIVLAETGAFFPTFAFLALWITSPILMLWLSAPGFPERRVEGDDALRLHRLARRTWRFFDDLVNEQNNWLPPDNSQLALRIEVAQRTSPTNIGMWLTAALSARDLGFLTPDELWRRADRTMATLGRLERYEGHLLNWYTTTTLEPLLPRYVSTVDSGNLLASLWVLSHGCHDAVSAPVLNELCLRGLDDTLSVIRDLCGRDVTFAVPLRELRRLFRGAAEGHGLIGRIRLAAATVEHVKRPFEDERSYWIGRLAAELEAWRQIIERYLPWMETLAYPTDAMLEALGPEMPKLRRRALHVAPSLAVLAKSMPGALESILERRGMPELPPDLGAWLDQLAADFARAQSNAAEMVKKFEALAASARQFADGINMRFLYDAPRRLFGVGYAVGGPVEFTSHYDLLASECRLASLAAIAKGDVPAEHWFALGRTRSPAEDGPVLLSWSGTMFEYLMPALFMRLFAGSLLDRACQQAVEKQIEYARAENLPWGVSESAFSALDVNQVYQYRAFGVPSLALKRGAGDDQVVAPYATILALLVDPAAAIQNIHALERLGLAGPMGLYESIDFSREKSPHGGKGVVVYTYMAHHQGMSLTALANVLHGEAMERRFHAELRVRAFESLLFERVPIVREPGEPLEIRRAPPRPRYVEEARSWQEPALVPRAHLNGNGRYLIAATDSGAGLSRWNDFDITRWRSDATLHPWGSYIYARDMKSLVLWSATRDPIGRDIGSCSAMPAADRIQYVRRVSGLETILQVTVAPEDDVEIRRLVITNRSLRARHIEFTSYAELALAPHRADSAHPAFAKLFVETECPEDGVLLAHRRLRSPEDPPIWAAHVLIGASGAIQFETDRAQFLGRGNTTATASALRSELSGSAGAVLDPIFSLRCRLKLEPRERHELVFLTIAAASREAVLAAVEKYRRAAAIARAFEMAWTRAQLEMRFLGVRTGVAHRYHELAGRLLYPDGSLRASASRLSRNRLGQAALWSYGISGDLPILAVTASDARGAALVREVLLAHNYWRLVGFKADLVILNQEEPSYESPLRVQLRQQIEAHSRESIDVPGGVFLRDWNAMPEDHRNLILAAATVVLHGNRGALHQQLVSPGEIEPPPKFVPARGVAEQPSAPLPFLELPYFNGIGGFTRDGREYCVYLGRNRERTPAPWINVIANPNFGTMVSESGLGCTWNRNSQSNRLTPWHNDPVSDPPSEAIYLRDDETGALWTATALPIRENDAYRARHGQGYTIFEHNSHAIAQTLTVFVPPNDPVKICRLTLRNDSSRPRRLTVAYFAEWVLGSTREDQQLHIETSFDRTSGAILAWQTWSGSTAGHLAFAAANPRATSWSGDRAAFFGRDGARVKPFALGRVRLDGRTGPALDPAAALERTIDLAPGATEEITFILGQAETIEAARSVIDRAFSADLSPVRTQWDEICGALQVSTPILSVDFLLNRWLLYQAVSCRFWGRTALYQSSGAFGFRDQLQDSLAFLYAAPQLAREHLLASAARQFPEGDVQHWWHPDTGLGVRTRCSDDLVWLPYAVAQYVAVTGDAAILDETIPFLDGPPLAEHEQEKMFAASASQESAPLWEHCRRALDHAGKTGSHGLPLIGNGDWNDGLNHAGIEGRGESVWLAWFLAATLESFAKLVEFREPEIAKQWLSRASELAAAAEQSAWDGEWYLRGFFDDGSPFGSSRDTEMRIDSIAQSWSVLCGRADSERARTAMASAERLLVNERDRLVMLFTPPFDHSTPHPGYIMGYPPGVRENGGQYTHGSLWMAMAFARLGDGARAVHLLQLMNPIEHSRDPESAAHYAAEPYVSVADVNSSPEKSGRAGWTWYTGSAAWMYRIWIEEVLGFELRGDRLTIRPAIPDDWPGFSITFRYRRSVYHIEVVRSEEAAAQPISLVDDGAEHRVTIPIPAARRAGRLEPVTASAPARNGAAALVRKLD